jgi:mono/diheme cytochrome c family protein
MKGERIRGASAAGLVLALASIVAAVAACGSGGGGSPSAAGPSDGRQVYAAKCAQCHGGNLEGTAKGPSHLSKVYEPSHHSDESFRRAIKQGSPQHHWNFGDMPPVAGMSDGDIAAVIAFVRAQQRERGFTG